MLRLLLHMKPSCQKQLPVCTEILRWCLRWTVASSHAQNWRAVLPKVDMNLEIDWKRAVTYHKMKRSTYITTKKKLLELLIPEAVFQRLTVALQKPEVTWADLKGDVDHVCAESNVGAALFGFAVGALLSQQVAGHCDAHFRQLDSATPWNVQEVGVVTSTLMATVDQLPNITMMPHQRDVVAQRLDSPLKATISSIAEDTNWRVALQWKQHAIAAGNIVRVWVDDIAFCVF